MCLTFSVLIIRTPCTRTVTQLLPNTAALHTKLNFTAGNSFLTHAARMYQLYYLKMKLYEFKRVGVTHSANKVVI